MKAMERIQDIAMRKFMEKGFDGVPLNDILREANVSKGSFYYHFSNKEDLYMSLIKKVIEEKWQLMEELGLLQPKEEGLFPLLHLQIRAALSFMEARPHYQQFTESVLREGNEALRKRVFAHFKLENRDRLLNLVEAAMRNGEVRDDIPAEQINQILMFFLQNLSEITGFIHMRDYDDGALWLLDFLENGLRKK